MTPFIKWAGGKRQLLPIIRRMIPYPSMIKSYYEPFVGGGALLFDLTPNNATINDINKPLINSYIAIRDNPNDLMDLVNEYDYILYTCRCPKDYYAYIKYRFNLLKDTDNLLEIASMFIFLNKHCFNGLYRENKNGAFNVPYNKSIISSIDKNNILSISNYLKSVKITNTDFEESVSTASKGDFVFIDSPYDESFTNYNKNGFSYDDHVRLYNVFKKLSDKGCFVMATNHNTEFINKLYSSDSRYIVNVRRSINSDGSNRVGKEIIITNYIVI